MNGDPTYHDESWKEEAPFLASLDKPEQEFDTPQGYFDDLPGKVMSKLSESDGSNWEEEAPLLASIERESADEAPEGYFDDLPSTIMAKIAALSEEEEWEAEAPTLAAIDKTEKDDVPEGYFDELPQKVLDRIDQEKGKKTAPGRNRMMIWFSAAAAIILLLTVGYFTLSTSTPQESEIFAEVEQLTEDEILNAIEMGEISDDEILELMGDQALASLSFTQEISDEDLEPYLEDIDLEDLDFNNLDLDEKLLEEYLN